MVEPHPADELATWRDLLSRLESGKLTMHGQGHENVTQREIGILKREIAYLERVLARLKGERPQPGES
jgi:hypothetical protein